ncbi:MAG: DUF3307 domain-containing protein [Halanaerobiaceae bacterium]
MLFSLLILAHVLADFPLQFDKISRQKKNSLLYLLFHVFIYFAVSLLLTLPYFSPLLLLYLLLLVLIHGLLDMFKIFLEKMVGENYGLEIFLLDQVLHIGIIAAFIPRLQNFSSPWLLWGFSDMVSSVTSFIGSHYFYNFNFASLILALAVLIFNFKGGTIFVRNLLRKYKSDIGSQGDKGQAIGNLERLLIIAFVVFGVYSLIGFMFTAKSLIRFKEVDTHPEKEFIEYYLIGSFSSIFLGFVSGYIIKQLLVLV